MGRVTALADINKGLGFRRCAFGEASITKGLVLRGACVPYDCRCQGAGADTGVDASGTKVALFPPPGELRNMEYGKMPEPVISRKLVTLHGGR